MNDEYTIVEAPAIEQLRALGYEYVHGDALSPDYSGGPHAEAVNSDKEHAEAVNSNGTERHAEAVNSDKEHASSFAGTATADKKAVNSDLITERSSWRDVVLVKRLRNSLKKINPWISDENLSKVVHDLTFINQASLMEANRWFYENLVKCMSYEQDLGTGRKGQTVRIIDFDNIDNNEFLVVNQFKVHGPKQNHQQRSSPYYESQIFNIKTSYLENISV